MVKYYGYYSNVSRGKRQIAERDDAIPCILEPLGDAKTFRKNWARLIRKIYEGDPLVCPKCQGKMEKGILYMGGFMKDGSFVGSTSPWPLAVQCQSCGFIQQQE